ncbi:MAG: hypothetical protein C0621_08805 [Desulfuromonas sp.]|nr:MAG: hypothetical protein C0621_08805 [Desulfuromonas sp.]
MTGRAGRILLWVLLWGVLGGCGYRPLIFPQMDEQNCQSRSFYLQPLVNQTTWQHLDVDFTAILLAALEHEPGLFPQEEAAPDLPILSGRLVAVTVEPSAYNGDDTVREYRCRLSVQLRLEATNGALLQDLQRVREEFFLSSADRGEILDRQRLALELAARRLAADLAAEIAHAP